LSLRAQGTLLRVLENRTVVPVGETREQRVDIQVLLATNRDLKAAAEQGAIKSDFLDRFSTQAISLRPLRERLEDLPALVQYFVSTMSGAAASAPWACRWKRCGPWRRTLGPATCGSSPASVRCS